MLSPKTYVLNFLPGQMIPHEVEAFGSVLSLEPYHERGGWNNSHGEGSPSGEEHGRGSRTSYRGRGRGGRNNHSTTRLEGSQKGKTNQSEVRSEKRQGGRNYQSETRSEGNTWGGTYQSTERNRQASVEEVTGG